VKKINHAKTVFTLTLAVYGIILTGDPAEYRFLDRVDLVAHEAGHMLFSWFGEFLMVIGGTIGQMFVPLAFTAYFLVRQERFSSSVTLFWAGQNLLNISVYVKDAQAMAMPLVSMGGGDAIHDWNYILTKLGLLRHDQGVGNLAYGMGLVTVLPAIIVAGYYSLDKEEEEKEKEK
jgi:hypothetical protein